MISVLPLGPRNLSAHSIQVPYTSPLPLLLSSEKLPEDPSSPLCRSVRTRDTLPRWIRPSPGTGAWGTSHAQTTHVPSDHLLCIGLTFLTGLSGSKQNTWRANAREVNPVTYCIRCLINTPKQGASHTPQQRRTINITKINYWTNKGWYFSCLICSKEHSSWLARFPIGKEIWCF